MKTWLDHPLDDLDLSPIGSPELSRIDDVCEQFETTFDSGEPNAIESQLERVEKRCRPWLLFELLCLEFELRGRSGSFDFEPYRSRFPNDTEIVERAIGHHCQRDTLDVPVRPAWLRVTGSDSTVALPADYEVVQEIGRGGQGVVYKARKKSLDCFVAVKVVSLASATAFDRLEREAKTVAKVRHPNIVAVHEIGTHGGQPYLVMEYVEGGNLAEVARRQPLDAKRCAGYLGMAARAIAAAHREGVLHRDVKPSNILVDRDQRVVVTDFGLAKSLKGDVSPTRTGDVLGTVNYMPPEQATGRPEDVGTAADVYSLGAVLYELLTGRPPIVGDNFVDTLQRLGREPIVPPSERRPDVHPDLEAICLRCLETTPADRYESASKLADELSRVRRGMRIESSSAPATPGPTRAPVRSGLRTRDVVVGVLALLAVGLFGWMYFPGREEVSTSVLPVPGEWARYRISDVMGPNEFEVRALRDVDGENGRQRELLVVTAGRDNGPGEAAFLRVDLDRLERERRLTVAEGYVWLGAPEKVLEATVFGAEYAGGVDAFAGWGDGERLAISAAMTELSTAIEEPTAHQPHERGRGDWPAVTLDRVVQNLAPLPEALPEVGQWKRYTFEFDVPGGRAECEVEVRGIEDDGPERWLLLQTKTVSPSGRVIWESGLVRADAVDYDSEKRLPVLGGSIWIGDRNAITRRSTIGGASFAPDFDELAKWHAAERFSVRDALHLLYDAEVWPRRSLAVRPRPVVGRNERVPAAYRPVEKFVDRISVPQAELPYDLATLPAAGQRALFRGSINHPGLPIGREVLYEVDLQGIADGVDGRAGQRLVALQVRSGRTRDEFRETALLWVDVDAYRERRQLEVVEGFEWIGDLESARDDDWENVVEFHRRFDQLEELHTMRGPDRLAIRDVLVLMFGADVRASTETLSQVRRAFAAVREDLGLDVAHEEEPFDLPGRPPLVCRAAGVEGRPLDGEDASVRKELTTHFLSHPDVPGWVSAKAELNLGRQTLFQASLELIGLPEPNGIGLELYADLLNLERLTIEGRPFDLAWIPDEDGRGARFSGSLAVFDPKSLAASGFAYDLALRAVGREADPESGREFRRIEIAVAARHESGRRVEEVASLLVHLDEDRETIDFGPCLIRYGEGQGVRAFDPESPDTRKTGFGVREVLYLLFNAKQVKTANLWVEDVRWYLSGRRREVESVPGAKIGGHTTSYVQLEPIDVNTSIGRKGRFEYGIWRSETIPFGFAAGSTVVTDEETGRKLFEATLDFESLDDGVPKIDPVVAAPMVEDDDRRMKAMRNNFNRLVRLRGRTSYSRAIDIAEEVLREYPDSELAEHVKTRLREAGIPLPGSSTPRR